MNHFPMNPMRLIICTMATLLCLLTACGSSEPAAVAVYPDVSIATPSPQPGMAQLVFYYPYSRFWSGKAANLDFNGNKAGMKSGSYFIISTPPNPQMTIAASLCGSLAVSALPIHIEAGKTYYIRITPVNSQSLVELIAHHDLSELPVGDEASAQTDSSPPAAQAEKTEKETGKTHATVKRASAGGPFTIEIIDEPVARVEMHSLEDMYSKPCAQCSS